MSLRSLLMGVCAENIIAQSRAYSLATSFLLANEPQMQHLAIAEFLKS
jgi:hypothetical protein